MLTKTRPVSQGTSIHTRKKGRFSPLLLIGLGVTAALLLLGGGFAFVQYLRDSHAAAAINMDCTLTVPANPLSAQGLATPYQLSATNAANGACNEANPNQSAFVQAAILDPATGKISIYEPLVIDAGTQPAVAPVVPTLPANAVVGIWFGSNGNNLTLLRQRAQQGMQGQQGLVNMNMRGGFGGACVNGSGGTVFGQFSYCNAPAFFRAANRAIRAGQITIPPLGTGSDGQACPSVRSFTVVDMDQSDNVQTKYLATANGQTAQFSAANQAALPGATAFGNPSDNALVTRFLDPALGCTPWTAPDLADNGNMVSALALDELQAAAQQAAPQALVPLGDPMTLLNGQPNLTKTNAYRVGVDQTPGSLTSANTTAYCTNIINISLPRLVLDQTNFAAKASPDPAAANSLFSFLANRLNGTLGANGLNCVGLLNIQNPVTLTLDGNGVVTTATIATKPVAGGTGTPTAGTGTGTSAVTGGATITLDPNAGTASVAINATVANSANQQVFFNVTDSANNRRLLHQPENTDGAGVINANTVINRLRRVTTLPATLVASITDNKGTVLASAPVVANGLNGTVTFGAAGGTTPAATPTAGTMPATTPTAGATPATTPTAGTTAGAQPWQPGVAYKVGNQVTFNGVTYTCLQAHTSQTDWQPPNVPALWQPV